MLAAGIPLYPGSRPCHKELSVSHNSPHLALNPGEVHVWFTFPQEINDPKLLQAYYGLMNEEEKQKQKRYYFERHRHNYLIARALVRSVLSRYVEKAPEEWQFSKNRYGRPEIECDNGIPPLRFNLAHTDGLVACGLTLEHDVGIDVENTLQRDINLSIAERFFSSPEVKALRSLPDHEKKGRFLDYWTLKESYIKACGKGLSIRMDQFSFLLANDRPLGISFDPRLDEDPKSWQFCVLKPTERHKAAVAIRKGNLPNFQISMKTIVPLVREQDFTCEILGES